MFIECFFVMDDVSQLTIFEIFSTEPPGSLKFTLGYQRWNNEQPVGFTINIKIIKCLPNFNSFATP